MAKKSTPDFPADIPSWLMTFSDVITLLMTFFILLLTFATDQPESFERMQVALFGGGGATGIAGDAHGALDKDAVLMRERPKSGRLTRRGSEMPPIHSDPVYESLAKGIAGLEEHEKRETAVSNSVKVPLAMLFSREGDLTNLGQQKMRMLARHLSKQPTEVAFEVTDADDVPRALALAEHLIKHESIAPGRIGVGQATQDNAERSLQITLTRQLTANRHGD